MAIYRGTTQVAKVYRGATEVQKIYRGATLVWEKAVAAVDPTVRSVSAAVHPSGSGSLTGESIAKPAGTTQGDLLVLYIVTDYGNASDLTPPAGFTEMIEIHPSGGETRLNISYKVATASEPSSYTHQAYPTGSDGFAQMVCVQDWDGNTANLALAAEHAAVSTTSFDAPAVTPKTARSLVLRSVAQDDDNGNKSWTWTAPTGTTLLDDTVVNSSGWSSGAVAHHLHTSSASTGTATWTVSTNAASSPASVSTLAIGAQA